MLPLSNHPSVSPSLSPAPAEDELLATEASVRVDRLYDVNYNSAKILETFVKHLGERGRRALEADIRFCQDDAQLVRLARHLVDAILKPFLVAGGQAPAPLPTPPSPEATAAVDLAMATIETATRAEQTRLRRDCLRRDGYRCVYSGSWEMDVHDDQIVLPPRGAMRTSTECAHIIPFALGSFNENDATETRDKAIIWFALHRYFPALREKITARNINQRANAVTLDSSVHKIFGKCKLAFSPSDEENCYNTALFFDDVLSVSSKSGSPLFRLIRIDDTIPMPDKDYLHTHFVISTILQMSGIGRQIEMAIGKAEADLDGRGLHPSGCTNVGPILSRILLMNI